MLFSALFFISSRFSLSLASRSSISLRCFSRHCLMGSVSSSDGWRVFWNCGGGRMEEEAGVLGCSVALG